MSREILAEQVDLNQAQHISATGELNPFPLIGNDHLSVTKKAHTNHVMLTSEDGMQFYRYELADLPVNIN